MEKKRVFYERWWFWAVIVVIIISMIPLNILGGRKNRETSVNAVNTNNSAEDNSELNENPYEVVNDYDGVYEFSLNGNNNYGTKETVRGIIEFKDGICNVKSLSNSEAFTKIFDSWDTEGFCGINNEDNSTFYFSIKSADKITYKCNNVGNDLKCELVSQYTFEKLNNKDLILTRITPIEDTDTLFNKIKEEETQKKELEQKNKEEQEKQTFISSCQTYTFEQMARNPDNFKGTNVKLTGEVVQVMEGAYSNSMRVNITKKGTYSTYYTDTIYVSYTPKTGEDKILEDDIITIYGTAQGDYSYTSTMGANITLPYVTAKYIILQK